MKVECLERSVLEFSVLNYLDELVNRWFSRYVIADMLVNGIQKIAH